MVFTAANVAVATVAEDLIENGLGEARTKKKFAILLLHAFLQLLSSSFLEEFTRKRDNIFQMHSMPLHSEPNLIYSFGNSEY